MKSRNTLLLTGLIVATLFSCKKTDTNPVDTSAERDATIQMSKDQATTDQLMEDANSLLDEAVEDLGLAGGRPGETVSSLNNLSCATVTVTPQSGFPRTITIDFGITGCTSPNGIFRRGKIMVVISDSLRHTGSTAVMTFDNYFVQGFKKEGTITWTNTTVPPMRSWRREVVGGRVTAPGGVRFWLHEGIRDVVQTAGNNTPHNHMDDEFSITGNSTVTNANNVTRTANILTALHKAANCTHIDMGTVRFQGPNHTVILDYGNGTCDDVATISVDGGAPQTITLP